MIFRFITKQKSVNLATIITRTVFTVMGAVTLFVLFLNFQATSRAVEKEIERTRLQTNSLVQALFNLELTSLRTQQDSYSRNDLLVQAISDGEPRHLDQFFASVDEVNPHLTPDFRYITAQNEMFWGDESYTFFGIEETPLQTISLTLTTSKSWHLVKTPSLLGTQFLLLRRTPIVNSETGEVLAMYHVGVVLNKNYSVMNSLKTDSNSDNVVMVINGQVIASTIRSATDLYTDQDVLDEYFGPQEAGEYIVIETPLKVSGTPTSILIYTVQRNMSPVEFSHHYNFWGGVLLLFMFVLGGVTWYWLNRRVSAELDVLTQYTSDAVDLRSISKFDGSPIKEFDQIGHTLEDSLKRLTEQEKQFEDLFNFSLSPILFWDVEGRVVKINPAGQKYFNSHKVDDETYQLLVDNLLPQIKMAATGATLTGVNIPIADKVFRWNLSPIIVDDEVHLVIAQSQDITSLIQAEKQSERARVEAEELARVRADFLAKMSHELRTPLNGILGVSQILRDSSIDSKMLEYVNVLCNSGEHLLVVLNDILDFSKLEQGKYSIQYSEFNPIETYQTVDKIFTPLCHEKGIEFLCETDFSDDAIISTDKVRLTQILFNLVSNGVKFTDEGQLTVSITHTNNGDDSNLHINVSDTGIGIEERLIDKVFEPFVQVSENVSPDTGGSGLGLTIIKNLVELLGGEYQIKSDFGVGTTFTVDLPIKCVEHTSVSPVFSIESKPQELFDAALNVLLVEDNHTNAFIARAFCEKYGMEITWVEDGQEAIELVKLNEYDLVLMDNQLPSIGGVEVTRIIRDELESDVPIFACTADGMLETKQGFLDVGANYIIIKPLKERELFQAFQYLKENFIATK
ncbi:LuxQ periplasmic sensor domain-containing protein [uncultured Vibrio sp.]|uniref:LuxQ periplasmic sensor domain-containing protein n=1 Tax=uncultured Vibrio sp. TaxID=114054 RepID=UPI0025E3FEF3|nr:LuxQ periplasmic sensor domain-containing protein [uncultured Vibrio sp.]